MNFNNNNKHEIKTKFRFIDNEIQGSTAGWRWRQRAGLGNPLGVASTAANRYGLRVC